MKTMWTTVCTFKREKGGIVEDGIAIGYEPGTSDIQVIVDINGKAVRRIHDFTCWPYRGSFTALLQVDVSNKLRAIEP